MRLPVFVDLRPAVDEVEDQGTIGSCTAMGSHKALEIAYERLGKPVNLSPMYVYYYSRKDHGGLDQDGSKVEYALTTLRDHGVCLEATWPYIESQKNTQPPAIADKEAEQFKILGWESYSSVPHAVDEIKAWVAQGKPVVIAVNCTEGMVGAGEIKNWKQTTWDLNTPMMGSHCMVVIGYDDASQRLLVQNSWGKAWGDGGFFGIPYTHLPKIITDARALELSIPYVNAGYMDDRAVFDTLITWAERKYSLGHAETQTFGPYIYRRYGLDYYGLDTSRQMIVHYADGAGFVDIGTADHFWGLM